MPSVTARCKACGKRKRPKRSRRFEYCAKCKHPGTSGNYINDAAWRLFGFGF